MNDTLVADTLNGYFKAEISNKVERKNNSIIVKLANGVENMGNQLMDVKEDIQDVKKGQNELSDKVTTLENRPAQETKKRWDSISEKLLWLFIAGVAGFLLAQVLPGVF